MVANIELVLRSKQVIEPFKEAHNKRGESFKSVIKQLVN